jgi:FkbM family methyltransferase
MRIYYGIPTNFIDVTDICLSKLQNNNIITIPSCDTIRASYFSDPLIGIHKSIIISINDEFVEYDEYKIVKIDLVSNTIEAMGSNEINYKLSIIHSKLSIKYGNLYEEVPEQKMAVMYLNGDEKILEIGGNVGRNSLIIASILHDETNLVTLECDNNIADQLMENRNLNNFNFHIEKSALSNRKLIQRGWDTKPSDILESGYNWVNTISLDELKNKYNIEFDTLVLDCEGAFYYILMDMPEILDNINLIIMENDYHDINDKNYIDGILTQNNFRVDYRECGGWGPCFSKFFEVWRR